MALPLPKVVADVGPGGGIVTAMRGMNALSESNLENQIKNVQAQYAPYTVPAEAISKLAYANIVQPQYLAKLLEHPELAAQLSGNQVGNAVNNMISPMTGQGGTGLGGGNAFEMLRQMQSQVQQNRSPLGRLWDLFTGNKAPQTAQNNLNNIPNYNQSSQAIPQQAQTSYGSQQTSSPAMGSTTPVDVNTVTGNNPNSELGQATTAWMKSPEAAQQAQKEGMYSVPPPQQLLNWYRNQQNQNAIPNQTQVPMQSQNQPEVSNNTYAENIARTKGIIKAGEELGTERGKSIATIGNQQLDLSNSGVILDRLIGITQNPEFQKMRNQIPYFQDKQLWWLSKNGTPEQQRMIGDLISTAEAFKSSTVNSFKGKALEKEFNLADKIKIDENDTMGVIQGKLRSLKTLKEIAESKNDIILGLMSEKNMNLGEATKRANKMVDTAGIEKQVDNILNPQPSEQDIQYMMKKRNLSREEIVKQLKAKGYKNVS